MKHLLKNIKTTIFGAFAGLPVIVEGVQHKNVLQVITGVSIFLTGLFASDAKKDN
jgi:uncharacterized membrane protein